MQECTKEITGGKPSVFAVDSVSEMIDREMSHTFDKVPALS